MRRGRAFSAAAGRRRLSSAAFFHLAILAISNFHHALGDHGSLTKTIQKTSHQAGTLLNSLDPALKLLDNMHPLHHLKRRWAITTLELEEEDKGPFPKPVGKLFHNISYSGCMQYLIRGPEVAFELFSVEYVDGEYLYVHRSIDREKTPSFMIRFDVADRRTNKILYKSIYSMVKIKDINDNVPEFLKKEFNITMRENHRNDVPVFNITAFDKDEKGSANSRVTYSLVSQRPHLEQTIFTVDASSGLIYIRGCSNYKTAKAFQLLIKATDHGTPQLSSITTINIAVEDSNNNLPRFTQENYRLEVSEGEMKNGILRFRVDDQDSPNTPAWRAKYKIMSGNEGGNFAIVTDSSTNEGVLSIKRPLIYDSTLGRSLVISVENEEPYFLCERGVVQNVPHLEYSKAYVNIYIINRNDAPQFNPPVLFLWQEEGVLPGTRIVQYTARDPDGMAQIIRYQVAFDPNGWVTVDEISGIVTTVKMLTRESLHINHGVYTIVIHAIDDGVPRLTGTGTIQLHLPSFSGNIPMLITPSLVVCDGKEMGPFIIKAEKKHSYPNSGSFMFELGTALGNVNNSWKLGKSFGDSVELFMLRSLPLGSYAVPFYIRDKQGLFLKQTLQVTVCRCLGGTTCEPEREMAAVAVGLGGRGIGAILAAFLLLMLAIGLLLWCSCASKLTSKPKKDARYVPEASQTLITYNTESPSQKEGARGKGDNSMDGRESQQGISSDSTLVLPPSTRTNTETWMESHAWAFKRMVKILKQRLIHVSSLENSVSYSPHVYAEEGTMEKSDSVWSLPGPDESNNNLPPEFFDTLGPCFIPLGKICSMELDRTHFQMKMHSSCN